MNNSWIKSQESALWRCEVRRGTFVLGVHLKSHKHLANRNSRTRCDEHIERVAFFSGLFRAGSVISRDEFETINALINASKQRHVLRPKKTGNYRVSLFIRRERETSRSSLNYSLISPRCNLLCHYMCTRVHVAPCLKVFTWAYLCTRPLVKQIELSVNDRHRSYEAFHLWETPRK